MVTPEQLAARREALAGSPDLTALLATLERRNAPLLARAPIIPRVKALLSTDGGVCPDDGAPLAFDPWSAEQHTCPRCGKQWQSERHHRHWARYQHLWVAERAAELATIAALTDKPEAARRASEIMQSYAARYFSYPNKDNVLGPSRLFFSTYLESLWITSFLGAASVLRAADALDEPTERAVTTVVDEAANLIGEYDERFSNRQTWNNAALIAIAVWFGDEELAQRAIAGQTGLSAHLLYGFRADGLWYEGENYHLFALRGMLTGIQWARQAGVDFLADARLAGRLGAALAAPAITALPDCTFPARKDARFGVSLAQPMYVEGWEVALGALDPESEEHQTLAAWLKALYASAPFKQEVFESYLHDAPTAEDLVAPSRSRLSWWSLLEMEPALPETAEPWDAGSVLLPDQGLAILRAGERYASLEAGIWGGGHGHPDRLNVTLHAGGTHWLSDPGTGSYVSPDLFWYRSTLAHNAPRLDGVSQSPGRAVCEMFDERDAWSWARGRFNDLTRTIVAGPGYVIDVLELAGERDHLLELPWHFAGDTDLLGGGRWMPAVLADDFVDQVERLDQAEGAVVIRATAGQRRLAAHLAFDGELLRMMGPGLPGRGERRRFYVVRTKGRHLRLVTLLEPGAAAVKQVRVAGDVIYVDTHAGVDEHRFRGDAWSVVTPAGGATLRGAQELPRDYSPIVDLEPPEHARGVALRLEQPPPLDGTDTGFDASEPLAIDLEDQYRRSEEPFPGPEDFSAHALAGWDNDALYLCVDVIKRDVVFRPPGATPLKLDNEPDDVHSDGLQIYVGNPEGDEMLSLLVVPEPEGRLRTSPADADVLGAWAPTDTGYRVTLAIPWPEWLRAHVEAPVGFDLIINEMLPDRTRRAGQLAWTGGNGWVYLRGDRQERERLGTLELVG